MKKLSTAPSFLVLAIMLLFNQRLAAGPISFEGFSDGTPVTTQIPSLIFANATVLTASVGLNELEFPPASGINVIFDDGGEMSIIFSSPVTSFGGYFTYLVPLTLTAFDTGNNPISQVQSMFSNNLALSGEPGSSPNEFLEVNFLAGIAAATITGDFAGGSFVTDNLTFTTAATVVPEIPTLINFVLLMGLLIQIFYIKKCFRRKNIKYQNH